MDWFVERDSPIPLYEQIKRCLREKILNGEFPQGTQLPTERELCDRFQVSRITVKRALEDLARAGLVRRIQGKGTIVERKRVDSNLDMVAGFTATTRRQGFTPGSVVVSSELREPDATLREAFQLPEGSRVRFRAFRRLLSIDEQPVAILTAIVTEEVGDQMLTYELENASFYGLYREITGRKVAQTVAHLTPIVATPEIARQLNVEPGTPHVHYRGLSYLAGDIPVELSLGVFSGDVFQWKATMYEVRPDLLQQVAPQLAFLRAD